MCGGKKKKLGLHRLIIQVRLNVSVQEMNKKSRQLKTAASVLAAANSLLPALPKATSCSQK